jgi:hypothetical protein
MSLYTAAIVRYGIIAPVMLNGVLFASAGFAIKRLEHQINVRKAAYALYEQKRAATQKLQAEVAPLRNSHKDLQLILRADPARLFSQILDNSLPKYKRIELERSSLIFLPDKGNIGRSLNASCSRIKSTFEGGFGPMQEVLLQLEALMPHAILEEFKITRKENALAEGGEHLAFDLTHFCWKSEDKTP